MDSLNCSQAKNIKNKVTTQNCHSGLDPESQLSRHSGLDPESPELEMLKRVQHDAGGSKNNNNKEA